jgi:hypothetical protein
VYWYSFSQFFQVYAINFWCELGHQIGRQELAEGKVDHCSDLIVNNDDYVSNYKYPFKLFSWYF